MQTIIKKRFPVNLCVALFVAGCSSPQTSQSISACDEATKLSNLFVNRIDSIDKKRDVDLDDIRTLIKPLSTNFNLGPPQCKKSTDYVIEATKKVIIRRSEDIYEDLFNVCSQSTENIDYHSYHILDVEKVAAIEQEKKSAKSALELIHKRTDSCR